MSTVFFPGPFKLQWRLEALLSSAANLIVGIFSDAVEARELGNSAWRWSLSIELHALVQGSVTLKVTGEFGKRRRHIFPVLNYCCLGL